MHITHFFSYHIHGKTVSSYHLYLPSLTRLNSILSQSSHSRRLSLQPVKMEKLQTHNLAEGPEFREDFQHATLCKYILLGLSNLQSKQKVIIVVVTATVAELMIIITILIIIIISMKVIINNNNNNPIVQDLLWVDLEQWVGHSSSNRLLSLCAKFYLDFLQLCLFLPVSCLAICLLLFPLFSLQCNSCAHRVHT